MIEQLLDQAAAQSWLGRRKRKQRRPGFRPESVRRHIRRLEARLERQALDRKQTGGKVTPMQEHT